MNTVVGTHLGVDFIQNRKLVGTRLSWLAQLQIDGKVVGTIEDECNVEGWLAQNEGMNLAVAMVRGRIQERVGKEQLNRDLDRVLRPRSP